MKPILTWINIPIFLLVVNFTFPETAQSSGSNSTSRHNTINIKTFSEPDLINASGAITSSATAQKIDNITTGEVLVYKSIILPRTGIILRTQFSICPRVFPYGFKVSIVPK